MEAIISAADMGFTGSLVGSSIPFKHKASRSEVRLHSGPPDGAFRHPQEEVTHQAGGVHRDNDGLLLLSGKQLRGDIVSR